MCCLWWLEFGSLPKSAAVPGRCVKVHCHGAGSSCFSTVNCTHMSQPFATCSTDNTQFAPVLSTPLALTGSVYLDTTKFQELFDPSLYVVWVTDSVINKLQLKRIWCFGCDAVWSARSLPIFLQNVGTFLPGFLALHPRRCNSLWSPTWEPQYSHADK
jgi:hypothetical protein